MVKNKVGDGLTRFGRMDMQRTSTPSDVGSTPTGEARWGIVKWYHNRF